MDMESSQEKCEKEVIDRMSKTSLYVWENDNGKIVATVARRRLEFIDSLAFVYTVPSERRKGYAMNLVYKVTEMIKEEGLLPSLYTDADYAASNACYKKLGYTEVGSLCTVGK